VAQMVKNLPAIQETQFRSLGRDGPLEKGKATHSSILAWRIPWTEEPGGPQSAGLHRVGHDERLTHTHTVTPCLAFWRITKLFHSGCTSLRFD